MLHSACIDGKHTEKKYSNCANHDYPSYDFPMSKLQKKVLCSYLGRRLRRWYPIRPPWHLFFHFPYQKYFLSPFISLDLTKSFRDLEDQMKHSDQILLKRFHFQKKLLVEVTILVL